MDNRNLAERVVDFAQEVVRICHELDYMKKQVISRQLMRSGTAIGASYAEGPMQKVQKILYTRSR